MSISCWLKPIMLSGNIIRDFNSKHWQMSPRKKYVGEVRSIPISSTYRLVVPMFLAGKFQLLVDITWGDVT